MKILLLAPQPFYTERGTPIAILNLAETLGSYGHQIDLLTYPDGENLEIENTSIHRVIKIPFIGPAPVGFSVVKVLYDLIMLFTALRMTLFNRYDVIHAVEESVYIGILCRLFRKPYLIYDMDSSMADQLLEKWQSLSFLKKLLYAGESIAVKCSHRTIAVCQALADKAKEYDNTATIDILEDVVMESVIPENETVDQLHTLVPENSRILLYVGNLEHYQGVDLVIEAMAADKIPTDVMFVVIGGGSTDIERCQQLVKQYNIGQQVLLLGPRPVNHLMQYLIQADALVSPRTKGVNTPMKIYSYLGAGKPVIATAISSHTQILNSQNSCLVGVTSDEIADGILKVFGDKQFAEEIGAQAQVDADTKYSMASFSRKLHHIYQTIETEIQ